MLGDLFPHKSSRLNNDIKKLFDSYSAFYKVLQNTSSNITIEKNLTQGINNNRTTFQQPKKGLFKRKSNRQNR